MDDLTRRIEECWRKHGFTPVDRVLRRFRFVRVKWPSF